MTRRARSIRGMVVVITGGARGIGHATAKVLAERGATVVIGDLDRGEASSAADGLGETVSGHALDVTDRAAFTRFLDEVEREHGRIDALVNNAGIMPLADLADETDATTTRQLEINLHAVIHGTRECVVRMRPRGSGHIVNVASAAGKIGFRGAATYCATKHAVVGLSEAVRAELRGTGVEVSCVMPGLVRTELISGLSEITILKAVTAGDVAEAIAAALERPKFDVFVPWRLNVLTRVLRLVPRRFAEWMLRRTGGDTVLVHGADSAARSAYEARAAKSGRGGDES